MPNDPDPDTGPCRWRGHDLDTLEGRRAALGELAGEPRTLALIAEARAIDPAPVIWFEYGGGQMRASAYDREGAIAEIRGLFGPAEAAAALLAVLALGRQPAGAVYFILECGGHLTFTRGRPPRPFPHGPATTDRTPRQGSRGGGRRAKKGAG